MWRKDGPTDRRSSMSYKMPKKHQVTPLERFMNPELEAAVYPSRLDKFCDTRHYSPFQRTIQNIGCSKWACAAPDGYEAPSLFKFNSNKAHFYVDRRVHELDCPAEYVADGSRAPPLDQMNITCRISYPPAPFQGFEGTIRPRFVCNRISYKCIY